MNKPKNINELKLFRVKEGTVRDYRKRVSILLRTDGTKGVFLVGEVENVVPSVDRIAEMTEQIIKLVFHCLFCVPM